MWSQCAQASFGRTWRTTLKLAGTYSSISETSSPKGLNCPLQCGQQLASGICVTVSRGKVSGKGLRFLERFSTSTSLAAGLGLTDSANLIASGS